MTTKDRWLMLYNGFIPTVSGIACLGAFLSLATMLMGGLVADGKARVLAYFLAFLSILVCVTWVANGASMILRSRVLLLQAEADSV